VDAGLSAWAPMYGHANRSRLFIKAEHKRGPDYFTNGTHYVDPGTVYVCDHVQLVVGLRSGRDRAKPWERPHIVAEGIPETVLMSGRRILAGEALPYFDVSGEHGSALEVPDEEPFHNPMAAALAEIRFSSPDPSVLPASEPPTEDVATSTAPLLASDGDKKIQALEAARFSLEKIGCQFYRCPGPTSIGPEDELCHVCRTLKTVSSALDG